MHRTPPGPRGRGSPLPRELWLTPRPQTPALRGEAAAGPAHAAFSTHRADVQGPGRGGDEPLWGTPLAGRRTAPGRACLQRRAQRLDPKPTAPPAQRTCPGRPACWSQWRDPPPRSLRPAPGRRGLGQRQAVRLSVSCRPRHAREASRCRGRNVANGPKVTPKRFDQRLGPWLLPSPLDLVDRQECTRFTFRRVRPGSRGPWLGLGPARRVRPPSPRVGPPGLRESVGGAEPHPSRGPARLLPVYCGRCVSGERVSRQLLPRALGRGGPSPWRLSPRLCPPARTSPESPSLGLRPRWPA